MTDLNRKSFPESQFILPLTDLSLPQKNQLAIDEMKSLIHQLQAIVDSYKESEIVLERLTQILKVLQMLEQHLIFILNVLKTPSREDVFQLKIMDQNSSKLYPDLKSAEDFSLVPLEDGLNFLILELIPEASEAIGKSFRIQTSGQIIVTKPEEKIFEMQLIATKLLTAHTFLPQLATFNKDDLISFSRNNEVWKELYKMATFKRDLSKDKILESMKNSHKKFDLGYAVVSSETNEKNMFYMFQNVVWYSFKKEQTEAKLTLCLNNIKVEDAIAVWNLTERPFYKHILKYRLTSVGFDGKLYFERLFPCITKELIHEEYNEGTLHDEELLCLELQDLASKKEATLENILLKSQERIRLRLLFSENLNLQGTKIQELKKIIKKALTFSAEEKKTNPLDQIDGVIIHIHGGCFVASSSSTHREYLNQWTNSLNKVIFSIDYRHAPANPYPCALDDVWQSYLWIVHYSESILGIKPDKIVLVGDCSGGNLALALCLRLIKSGLKVPHGCLLIYPILCLDYEKFSPSYFWSIGDPLLPYNLLKPCLEAYVTKDFDPKLDPYLSPIVASDEFLVKLPPIRILTGSNDPVYDDSWRFMDRLRKVEHDAHIVVHEGIFHGFLKSDDLKNFPKLIEDGCKLIKELFLIEK